MANIYFDEQEFFSDFDTLPLNVVYSSDDPEERLEYFNSMFNECLERHAPLQRVRVTRPPGSWMEDSQIRSRQQLRNKFKTEVHQTHSVNVQFRVPQGLITGPMLFTVFIRLTALDAY